MSAIVETHRLANVAKKVETDVLDSTCRSAFWKMINDPKQRLLGDNVMIRRFRFQAIIISLIVTATVTHASVSFVDTFDNPDLTNPEREPVAWLATFDGQISIEDGAMLVGDTAGGLGGAVVEEFVAADVAVETHMTIHQATDVGMALRIDPSQPDHCYFSTLNINRQNVGLWQCAESGPFRRVGGSSAPVGFDPRQQDTKMRLQIIGEELGVWVWPADEPRPEAPLLTATDSVLTDVGGVGLFATDNDNRDVPSKVAFHEFRVIVQGEPGDFDGNGVVDAHDIDMLSNAIRSNDQRTGFDLDQSGQVNRNDRTYLVENLLNSWFGDSNLDGQFDSGDFVVVFQAGQFEDGIASNSSWTEGDWNGDAEFDSGDFVLAFQSGGFEQGRRAGAISVPEPSPFYLMAIVLFAMVGRRR